MLGVCQLRRAPVRWGRMPALLRSTHSTTSWTSAYGEAARPYQNMARHFYGHHMRHGPKAQGHTTGGPLRQFRGAHTTRVCLSYGTAAASTKQSGARLSLPQWRDPYVQERGDGQSQSRTAALGHGGWNPPFTSPTGWSSSRRWQEKAPGLPKACLSQGIRETSTTRRG